MKVSRKALLLLVLVSAVVTMSFAMTSSAAAQGNREPCTTVGQRTSNNILVDVPSNLAYGTVTESVQCRVLNTSADRPNVGTPIVGQRLTLDYPSAIVAVDVWTARGGTGSDFDPYSPAVRVCFKASAYGVDAATAVGPAESAAGQVGAAIMYSDARYIFADRFANNPYGGYSRNATQLDIVDAGRELGYVCADLGGPGLATLVSGLPGRAANDPLHPNYGGDTPDRCRIPSSQGGRDCLD